MQKARIFKPTKTAMQSGTAKTKAWRLEFEPEDGFFIEGLMGWTGSTDTTRQLNYRLNFDTKEEAIAYAEKYGIPYDVFEPHVRHQIKKSYADNFKYQEE